MSTNGRMAVIWPASPRPDIASTNGSRVNSILILRPAGESLTELLAELFKRAEHYSLPNPPHRVKVKVEVMQRVAGRCRHLAGHEKMTQIGPRKIPAGIAAALGIRGRQVLGVPCVLDHQRALAGQQLAVSS